ncbi:MAG: phosphotransferase family protein [Actinobacteria bacterium]|nr:phosphotransferase family protein [Actinomycetota bacterium]
MQRPVDDRVQDEQIREWIAANVGGEVTALVRQARWRPVWFVDVDRDGERLELCVRGERNDIPGVWPLRHEMTAQALMEAGGIPVPKVYGWCDEPAAFVTDRVPGRADFEQAAEAERDAVMDEYMGVLAAIHALDPAPFVAAGVDHPDGDKTAATVGMRRYEHVYRADKKRPDPFLEFCLAWLKRNPLDPKGRESVIVWDSGQLHHEGGHLVAVLDVELAHVGDPMMDLAGFRQRDSILHYGDMDRLYAEYEARGGVPVDMEAIQHHNFAFTLSNQLAFHSALADPAPESDYMTNLQWCCETNLFAVEALAEILGIELPTVEIPDGRVSVGAVGSEHLVGMLRTIAAADEFEQYRLRTAFRLARHLQRVDEIGDACVAADLDDLHALLGRRPETWQEGDAALEAHVLADDGADDEALVLLFHRRLWRAHQMLGPAGSAMTRHNPVQPFRG